MSCAWYQRDGKRCFPLSKGASFAFIFFIRTPHRFILHALAYGSLDRVVNKV